MGVAGMMKLMLVWIIAHSPREPRTSDMGFQISRHLRDEAPKNVTWNEGMRWKVEKCWDSTLLYYARQDGAPKFGVDLVAAF